MSGSMVRDGEDGFYKGAAAVTMPGGELFTLFLFLPLERGTIDATEWGTLSI